MKYILFLSAILQSIFIFSQNVGINQPNPTNALHISPFSIGDNPVRIDGVQPFAIGDTALLVINQTTGIVKYINRTDFVSLISNGGELGTDSQNIDSLILNGYNLETFISNGNSASVDLSPLRDSIASSVTTNITFQENILSLLYDNADTLLHNTTFINNLRDSIDTDIDSLVLNNNTLTIYENGTSASVDLSSLSDNDSDPTNEIELPTGGNNGQVLSTNGSGTYTWITDNAGTDNQNIAGSSFNSTTGNLVIGIQNGTNQTLNLNGLKDHDWYEVGGTTAPDNITDNIFTQSNVGIKSINPTTELEVDGVISVPRTFNQKPSYSFINDLQTGIYQPAIGEIGIVTGNRKARAHFTTNEIRVGNNLATKDLGTESKFIIEGSENTPNTGTRFSSLGFSNKSNQTGQSAAEIAKILCSSQDATTNQGRMEFQTKNGSILSTRMIIDKNGNVGIGTKAPQQKLHVDNGAILIQNSDGSNGLLVFDSDGNGTTAISDFASISGLNGGLSLSGLASAISAPHAFINNIGDLGVGTILPLAKLHVEGGDAYFTDQPINNFSTSRSAQAVVTDNLRAASDNGIRLYDGNSNSHLHIGSLTYSYFQAYNTSSIGPGTLGTSSLDFDDNANFANISLNALGGNVGIGTSGPNNTLSVNGTANKPGGGTWTVFSDKKLKKNINSYNEGLELITKVRTVNFQYNEKLEEIWGKSNAIKDKVFQGVIAQELQIIAPDMVNEVNIDIKNDHGKVIKTESVLEVDPNKFTYAIINAIQQQQKQIEELQKSNDLLIEEIKALKK